MGKSSAATGTATPATPGTRTLRAQGRRTRDRLLDAGLQVLGERGYQATRVHDVVRVAETSHGTFYLYFQNKDDLFRALATRAADEMAALADDIDPITPDASGLAALRSFLGRFHDTYVRYGPVIRAWAENQVEDDVLVNLGLDTFGGIAAALMEHMTADGPGVPDPTLAATVFIGTLERVVYFVTSRPLGFDAEAMLDELATMLHRAYFAG